MSPFTYIYIYIYIDKEGLYTYMQIRKGYI